MSNSVSSGGGGRLFVYDESRNTYDLNTRILATAVICLASVVLLMIFLHLYVRHVLLRCHRGARRRTAATSHLLRFYVNSPAHDDPATHFGLDPAAIAALPTHTYRTQGSKGDHEGGGSAECAICLSAVEEEELVRVLPSCKHIFHVDCIDMWLGSHSTCPVCRAAVEPPPAATVDVGEAQATAGAAPTSQEAASSESKELGSASSRFGSLRRMLSWERSTGRRTQGESMEDLERQ
ncbi:hypothetical protein Cni_G23321 [Canna indica]|uniref:RING-type E3 ubiquitin transferase n=1 Tax=Canna indica TaxID=4628 RepID=A0AAQ3QJ30_9LILI|nr:hypothetical protein Cni_G23321 [Canna indica]